MADTKYAAPERSKYVTLLPLSVTGRTVPANHWRSLSIIQKKKSTFYTLGAQINVARSLAQMGPIYGNTWPCQDKVTGCFQTGSNVVSYTQWWCQAPVPSLSGCPSCLPTHPRVLWSPLNYRTRTMTLVSFGWRFASMRAFLTWVVITVLLRQTEDSLGHRCPLFRCLLRKLESTVTKGSCTTDLDGCKMWSAKQHPLLLRFLGRQFMYKLQLGPVKYIRIFEHICRE